MRKNSNTWSSHANEYVRCPYPNCTHIGTMTTKLHCRIEHGMDRETIGKKYWMPTRIIMKTGVMSNG